jgi:hypothetical protein
MKSDEGLKPEACRLFIMNRQSERYREDKYMIVGVMKD